MKISLRFGHQKCPTFWDSLPLTDILPTINAEHSFGVSKSPTKTCFSKSRRLLLQNTKLACEKRWQKIKHFIASKLEAKKCVVTWHYLALLLARPKTCPYPIYPKNILHTLCVGILMETETFGAARYTKRGKRPI